AILKRMNATTARRVCLILVPLFGTIGCDGDPVFRKEASPPKQAGQQAATPKAATEKPAGKSGEAKRVQVGKNVVFERQENDRRRVLVNATVCLREGQLEMFLTRKRTKEHEAILAADVDARDIHKALLVAGAKAGTPVRFVEKGNKLEVTPPSGS